MGKNFSKKVFGGLETNSLANPFHNGCGHCLRSGMITDANKILGCKNSLANRTPVNQRDDASMLLSQCSRKKLIIQRDRLPFYLQRSINMFCFSCLELFCYHFGYWLFLVFRFCFLKSLVFLFDVSRIQR